MPSKIPDSIFFIAYQTLFDYIDNENLLQQAKPAG